MLQVFQNIDLLDSFPAKNESINTAYDRFHGNGSHGEITTKKEQNSQIYLKTTLAYNKYLLLTDFKVRTVS